ncbi:MAG: hypothetical protein ACE5KK_06905 [Candidatus Brocadiales bacterium]
MLETITSYMNLYTVIAAVAVLLGLGYFLKRWYMVSPYRYGGLILLIAIFLSLGWLAVVKYGISLYWIGGLYALILIGCAVKCYYHITWKDITGKFYRPKPTT